MRTPAKRSYTTLFALLAGSLLFAQPGTLDIDFSDDGIEGPLFTTGYHGPNLSAVLSDGTAITASSPVGSFRLTRMWANGTWDAPASAQGLQYGDGILYSEVTSIIALPGDKVLVVGTCMNSGRVGAAQYLSTLEPDATFGTNGSVVMDLGSTTQSLSCVERLNDGRLLLGGTSGEGASDSYMTLVMLQANGSIDVSWGTGGILVFASLPVANVNTIDVLPDGRLLVAGGAGANSLLMRLLANGELDTSFGTTGYFVGNGQSPITHVIANDDGSFYTLRGHMQSGNVGPLLERRLSAGGLDPGFNSTGGRYFTAQFAAEGYVNGMLKDPTGRILLGGDRWTTMGTWAASIVRVLPNGTLDNTFGSQGVYAHPEAEAVQYFGFSPAWRGSSVLMTGTNHGGGASYALYYFQVVNEVGTSVAESERKAAPTTWPNPAQDVLHVRPGEPFTGLVSAVLRETSGRIVRRWTGPNAASELVFEVGDIAPGMYLLQLEAAGRQAAVRVVKK